MAKILCVSDPHYHNYKQHSKTIDGKNSRLIDVDRAMEAAMKLGISQKVDLFTISGDIFHERGRIRPSVFNRAYGRIKRMAERAPVILNIGNHDMEDFKLGASSIDTFESIDRVYVMGGTEGYSHLEIRGLSVLGIQYFHKTEDFKETYERACEAYDPDVVLIHQGIDDFRHLGIPMTGIDVEYLQSITKAWILCGHYHSPNILGDSVINVGAPLQHTFGDEGIERGCWVLDPEKSEAIFYPLDVTPKFVTVKKKADVKLVKGNFVRVVAKTPRTAKSLEKACIDEGAKAVTVQVDKNYTTAHEKTVAVSSDPKQMIADYCDINPKFTPHKASIIKMHEKVCV